MQPVIRAPRRSAQPAPSPRRADSAPSRWSYRRQRLMLTPAFRLFLRAGLPLIVVTALSAGYLANEERRDALRLFALDLRDQVVNRPEFMVQAMVIEGASDSVDADIREIMPVDLPVSSFGLDLPLILQTLRELPAIKEARVFVRNGGILQISVVERAPALVWRTRDGLELLDETGAVVRPAETRAAHPELPLVAGEGADQAAAEALALLRAAGPLGSRVRGLVRISQRRWDLVLDRGQRIQLPQKQPVQALERVLLMHKAQDLLERDLALVDMRLADRPTIRMSEAAVDEWWRVRNAALGD